MRILHIYKDYYPVVGGIENHIKLLAERQAAAGHQVTVLATSQTRKTCTMSLNGVTIIKAARLGTVASTPISLRLPWEISRLQADISHLHFPYPVGEVSQFLLGHSRATVITYHSDVVRQRAILCLYAPLMKRVLHNADCVIATTPNYIASSEILRQLRARCRVIPFGIDRDPFLNFDRAAALEIRNRLGRIPIVLFVGVLRYYKGLTYLLDAMPRIKAHLLVVGDGPLRQELEMQAARMGISSQVTFVGRVSDKELPAYYGAADIFVLPACERSEAFGLVQVEAMSSGLPVISTELGTGTSYVNKHMESGLVVPPKDPEALSQAINRLLIDEILRKQLAEGALRRSELFDVARMMHDIDALYEEVLIPRPK